MFMIINITCSIFQLHRIPCSGTAFSLIFSSRYDPRSQAQMTLYGPSHLGPNFPWSSCLFASLFRSTQSPTLNLVSPT
jgi:hypothetical protein